MAQITTAMTKDLAKVSAIVLIIFSTRILNFVNKVMGVIFNSNLINR